MGHNHCLKFKYWWGCAWKNIFNQMKQMLRYRGKPEHTQTGF